MSESEQTTEGMRGTQIDEKKEALTLFVVTLSLLYGRSLTLFLSLVSEDESKTEYVQGIRTQRKIKSVLLLCESVSKHRTESAQRTRTDEGKMAS